MGSIRDVLSYFCQNVSPKSVLSKARLTKMVYLADWKSCIDHGHQVTDTTWHFNHFGPYVPDVVDAIRDDPAFEITVTENMFGSEKEVVSVKDGATWPTLTREDLAVLDHVIDTTRHKNWREFINLVYSTYPVLVTDRYADMDLVTLAEHYKREVLSIPMEPSSSEGLRR